MTLNARTTNNDRLSRIVTRVTCDFTTAMIACAITAITALVVATAATINTPARAYAEDIDTSPLADALQQKVEASAAAYDEAVAHVQELDKQIEENSNAIAELEAIIPYQEERANSAMVDLYKAQRETSNFINIVLCSESFSDFITRIDYFNKYTQMNLDEIAALNQMKTDLAKTREDLEANRQQAAEEEAAAEAALQEAQAARQEAQQRALEESQRQAAELAAQREAAAAEQSSSNSESSENDASSQEENGTPSDNIDLSGGIATDTADWTSEEDQFVAEWTGRINNYLAGSPLSGQGETFARAAWTYGVDPRWSPAISCVESSKGAYCFLPHNAWGWGSSSWDSWEDAINSHVRGLARGYGYTLTYQAACKYCPPNADHWYSTCLSEMNKI